jgi:hypothetical protein
LLVYIYVSAWWSQPEPLCVGALSWGITTCLCVDTGFNTVLFRGVLTQGSTLCCFGCADMGFNAVQHCVVLGVLNRVQHFVCGVLSWGTTTCLCVDTGFNTLFVCGVFHYMFVSAWWSQPQPLCLLVHVCVLCFVLRASCKTLCLLSWHRVVSHWLVFAGFCCVLFFVTGSFEQERTARLSDLRVTTFGQYLQCFLACIPPTIL